MEIEVGEYIRDIDGVIFKVNEIKQDDEGDDLWLEGKLFYGAWKSMVAKHSKNIIDLIEVGDYVNGWRVFKITTIDNKKYVEVEWNDELCANIIFSEKDIKSIVTKEQFKNIEYIIK